jgi:hypothetical protein
MSAVAEDSERKGGRKSYLLRVNEALFDELSKWASEDFRSVNGQIELILQRAVEERRKRYRRREID